jgi:hypothetical protein
MMTLPGRPTHHAPSVSLSSFKSHCFAAVAAASLLVPALPASAISVRIEQDDDTRFAFDVVWGAPPALGSGFADLSLGSTAYVYDSGIYADGVQVISDVARFFLPRFDWFYVHFNPIDRSFSGISLDGFDGVQYLPLPGEDYGARFVYGTRYPTVPPTGVPDNDASALLLAAGLAGLTLLRRTVV